MTNVNVIDTNSSLDNNARVLYLRSLGYTIDTWEGYAQAEINEIGSELVMKVA